VLPYVKFTQRLPIVQPFTPEENEDRLYNLVSEYLRRNNLQALPASQRSLMTLVLLKLLASSTFAIAGALDVLSLRLQARLKKQQTQALEEQLETDYEALDETAEEWSEDETDTALSEEDRNAIEKEIADLEKFRELAVSIEHNAKGSALLTALDIAFARAAKLGAAQKAVIFTESRRTQSYLLRVLAQSPWKDGIVLFNGSNNDERSRKIYAVWLKRYQGTDRVTGSRTADLRSALVDYFREQGQIMISTEAGAEGINLQFSSLVVNYDLPWNPQRIEQRIGRCHRYGQQHDVVVVNFLNQKNEADQRVFQLLSEKFKLFEGVFGASDEVLGAIESGVDFEKRIADIYHRCRRPEEINAAFDQLQLELNAQIDDTMKRTRQQLFENFDDEVREKLRIRDEDSRAYLNQFERMLMQVTRHELNGHAEFTSDSAFRLKSLPFPGNIPLGLYELPRRSGEAHLYRLNHPLAERILVQAKTRSLPPSEIIFNLSEHDGKVSVLESLAGKSGVLSLHLFTVESLDQGEDYLIFSGVTDSEEPLEEGIIRRLFSLSAKMGNPPSASPEHPILESEVNAHKEAIQQAISRRNAAIFEAEAEKLDGWADDLKVGLEQEIKELDRQIKDARRTATAALTLEEKLMGQKQVKALEQQRNAKRRALFDAQDEIDRQRERLIAEIEGKLQQRTSLTELFRVRWKLV
jgi:adenine-specific DNA-methyltransferase